MQIRGGPILGTVDHDNIREPIRSSVHQHRGTEAILRFKIIEVTMSTPISFHTEQRRRYTTTRSELNVALIYETLSAALWAVESLSRMPIRHLRFRRLRWTPVCFSKLEGYEYRDLATAATVRADLILVTTSGGSRTLPDYVERWLEDCLARRESAAATVATLFRAAEVPDGADSLRLQSVQRLAQKTGRGFVALGVDQPAIRFA